MNNQNLIIYNYLSVFEILSEIENNLNFKIIKLNKEDLSSFDENKYLNFIFLTKSQIPKINNQFILDSLPIKLSKLVEKIEDWLVSGKSKKLINSYIIENKQVFTFNAN